MEGKWKIENKDGAIKRFTIHDKAENHLGVFHVLVYDNGVEVYCASNDITFEEVTWIAPER